MNWQQTRPTRIEVDETVNGTRFSLTVYQKRDGSVTASVRYRRQWSDVPLARQHGFASMDAGREWCERFYGTVVAQIKDVSVGTMKHRLAALVQSRETNGAELR